MLRGKGNGADRSSHFWEGGDRRSGRGGSDRHGLYWPVVMLPSEVTGLGWYSWLSWSVLASGDVTVWGNRFGVVQLTFMVCTDQGWVLDAQNMFFPGQ